MRNELKCRRIVRYLNEEDALGATVCVAREGTEYRRPQRRQLGWLQENAEIYQQLNIYAQRTLHKLVEAQDTIALGSAESKLCASVKATSETLGLIAMGRDLGLELQCECGLMSVP